MMPHHLTNFETERYYQNDAQLRVKNKPKEKESIEIIKILHLINNNNNNNNNNINE